MHIKESPVEGIKREFAGFVLDASKVELHSADKCKICLPYSGKLPDALQNNDGAYISISISVGLMVNVGLIIKNGKKEHRYPVEATSKEKHDLLFNLFFVDKGGNSYHTRWDTGLTRYWLGNYRSAYSSWSRFVYEGRGIDGLIDQLSHEALKQVVLYIGEYGKTT